MGTETISIVGLDKAVVLAALYNASRPQGMGFMHYNPTPMTADQAKELLNQTTYFDYLQGRVMKLDLSTDEISPWGTIATMVRAQLLGSSPIYARRTTRIPSKSRAFTRSAETPPQTMSWRMYTRSPQ